MNRFATLYGALDRATGINDRVDAMAAFFAEAAPAEAAAALWLLTGNRPRRLVGPRDLRQAALSAIGIAPWLFEASYGQVGDLAETIALLLPESPASEGARVPLRVQGQLFPIEPPPPASAPLDEWLTALERLAGASEEARGVWLRAAWRALDVNACFVLNKVLTGGFRVGVSATLVQRAVARVVGVAPDIVAERLAGAWTPSAAAWAALWEPGAADGTARPYPFMLAHPLEGPTGTLFDALPTAQLGPRADWHVEWKWDGVRAQIVHGAGAVAVWSRGEERLTDVFPELARLASALPPGSVLDGEVLAWPEDASSPAPFGALQTRLGAKPSAPRRRGAADPASSTPVAFCAFDCLAFAGEDLRSLPLAERRARLHALPPLPGLRVSELLEGDWEALAALRQTSRERGVEGFVLKRADAPYRGGRHRGDWWKWKVDPYTVDAVLVQAQAGHGKRAGVHSDYTFAVWDGDRLVPFARAYSGLTNAEIAEVDRWVRAHTRARHGPVRVVDSERVFEIAFEGIAPSRRHAAGVAVRFPRIVRRRDDKRAADADTLATVRALLPPTHGDT